MPNTNGVPQIEGFLAQKRPQSFRGHRRKTSPMKVPKETGDLTWCSSIVIKQYCHSVPDTGAVGMGWCFNIELLLPCLKNFDCLVKWIADTGQSTVIHTQFYGLFFLMLWHETERTQHKGFCLLELTNVGFLTQKKNPWWYPHKNYSAFGIAIQIYSYIQVYVHREKTRKILCFALGNNCNIVKMAHLQHPIWSYDILLSDYIVTDSHSYK